MRSYLIIYLAIFGLPLLTGFGECRKLNDLRKKLSEVELDAYIVPGSDYHGSEIPAERDKRRQWITGFTGSYGDAVVSKGSAALFTSPGLYGIQAKRQLTKEWEIHSTKDTNMTKWLTEKLAAGSRVGADPKTIGAKVWVAMQKQLNSSGIELVGTETNLIDQLWTNRPQPPDTPLFIHDIIYTGQNLSSKVDRLRRKMEESNSTVLVLTALDDIAWTLNLRGGDSAYSPIFASFLVLSLTEGTLYVRPQILSQEVRDYLNSSATPIRTKDFDDFWSDWNDTARECSRCFVPQNANYFIYSAVDEERRHSARSPVVDMRAYKTRAEVEASRQAHISDAIALCMLFNTLEEKMEERRWRESEVAGLAGDLRGEQPENRGRSFGDIVAAGSNAAQPHYRPVEGADSLVNSSVLVLIDTGGQYLGGTTDTTRTIHLGTPRPLEVEVYSRLLKGVARLATAVFPEGTEAAHLDSLLRTPLYQAGLGYRHGSVHGTGIFLNVHEDFNGTYYENFIGSQEPGYYEENDFGMRLENLVVVVPANVTYQNKTEKRLLTFSPLTLVPYERKLINASIFDESELAWVNKYHQDVLNTVGKEIQKRGDQRLYQWLVAKTSPIKK